MNSMQTNVKILKVLLAEAPPSSQVYHRPFKMEWREEYTDQLLEATQDGTVISAGSIQNVAQQMLVPSASHAGAVHIANGFDIPRCTVTMVIEVEDIGGRKTQEILSGYTDHMGMSALHGTAQFDHNMRIFFNNIGTLQITQGSASGGYGMYQYSNATEILTPVIGWDNEGSIPVVNREATSMRPKDVLASLGEGAMGTPGVGGLNAAPVMGNSTYQFGVRPKRSTWDNNVASEFTARVFTGVRDTMLNADSNDRQYGNALQKASEQSFINEPMAASSSMLALLSRRSSYKSEWSVTLGEILRIDPTVAQRIQPIMLKQEQRQTFSAIQGGSQGWQETSFNSQIGQLATLIMPTAMAKFALGAIHFIAHSETLDGSVDLRILNAYGVSEGINPRPIMELIRRHLMFEVYPMLTQSGRFQVYIEANISLGRISTIKVGVNGAPPEPFMISTYCSAAYSPCMAQNSQSLSALSENMGKVASILTAAAINSGPGIIRPDGERINNISYGPASNSSVPLANLNLNPTAPIQGGGGGLGF